MGSSKPAQGSQGQEKNPRDWLVPFLARVLSREAGSMTAAEFLKGIISSLGVLVPQTCAKDPARGGARWPGGRQQ